MKKMFLTLAIVFFAASVSAQTLQDFESSFDENFQKDLAGGEGFSGFINFSSGVDRSVPLVVEVTVESDETSFAAGDMKGEEFDVSTTLISTGYDWKPVVWDRVQRGEGEILVPDDSFQENESIPEAVYVSEKLGDSRTFGEDSEVANISEEDFPGFAFVETRSELESLDLTYDPEETPAAYIESDLYTGENYLPKAGAFPEKDGAREEFADGLNASDYSLMAPQLRFVGGHGVENNLVKSIRRPAEDTLKYSFTLQDGAVHTGSQNSVLIQVDADQRIKPDSFDFSFKVKSEVGVMGENKTEEVNASQPETVNAGSAEVSVNASADANVTVQAVEQVSAPDPSPESGFVGGVSVDVSNESGEVEAAGNISIEYDQDYIEGNNLDEDSMQVYYYNSTQGVWTSEGVEVVRRDTVDNTVVAEADHFSTYAAFAEEQEPDDSTDSAETVFISDNQDNASQTGNQADEDQTQDQQENQSQQDEEEQPREDSENQDTTGQEGQETEDQMGQQPSNRITGQFLGSETNLLGLIIGVLVAMTAVLEYSGKIELRALSAEIREFLEQKLD